MPKQVYVIVIKYVKYLSFILDKTKQKDVNVKATPQTAKTDGTLLFQARFVPDIR